MPIWASFSTTWWNIYYIFALVSLYTSSPACKQARWLEREFSMVLQKMLASHHRVCSISCNTQLAFTSRSWLKWTINGLFRHVNYSSNLLSPILNHSNTHVLMVPDHFSYLLINSIKQSEMFALSLEIALYCNIMAKSRFSAFSAENVYMFLP